MVVSGKKLLVLDVAGLLLGKYFQSEPRPPHPHDAIVNRFYVYKRPFCEEFLEFCFENFVVGIWSSAREYNVRSLVDYLFKEHREKLAFVWHQGHCTHTGFKHPESSDKPIFLKKLARLWEKDDSQLPWEQGDYGPTNTLLIDDSAYKAIGNPSHTAIFPKPYDAEDAEDNFLGGELLKYLKGVAKTKSVRKYLAKHRFGEPEIAPTDPRWSQIFSSGDFKQFWESVATDRSTDGGDLAPPSSAGTPASKRKRKKRRRRSIEVVTEFDDGLTVTSCSVETEETKSVTGSDSLRNGTGDEDGEVVALLSDGDDTEDPEGPEDLDDAALQDEESEGEDDPALRPAAKKKRRRDGDPKGDVTPPKSGKKKRKPKKKKKKRKRGKGVDAGNEGCPPHPDTMKNIV